MMKVIISVILSFALIITAASANSEKDDFVIELDFSLPNHVNAAWLGYYMERELYIKEHRDHYNLSPGVVVPTFDEEVEGRLTLVQIWKELKEKDQSRTDTYLDQLLPVHAANFMAEYVWVFLKRESWSKEPERLRLTEFMEWQRENLKDHRARTYGSLSIKGRPARPDAPGEKARQPGGW